MKVSVIIPTYNGASHLPKLLDALNQQTIDFELIIIDSSSTDETISLVTPYAQKILTITQNQFDHGGTRTKAAKQASGELLIFLTQDALPLYSNTLEILLSAFENPKTGVAYGRQLPYDETNIFGKHLRAFNYPAQSYLRSIKDKEKYGMKTAFLSDSFSAYRKSAMQEVDYFKDGLIVGEDNHITAKLLVSGWQVAYVAEAEVYHSHSYTPLAEFRRYFDIGVYHTHEDWILHTFGKVEGEGGKYVKSEWHTLIYAHAYMRIPEFFLRNGLKYLGYKLGRHYTHLPQSWIDRFSMHRSWWEKMENHTDAN